MKKSSHAGTCRNIVQDWSPHMSSFLKGSQISALHSKGWSKSKASIRENKNEIPNSYSICAWIIWHMFPIQCEESKINCLNMFLVVIVPFACWFLWRAYYIEDFKRRLHFQYGVALWRVVLWEVYLVGPNHVWRALKTSILNTGHGRLQSWRIRGRERGPTEWRWDLARGLGCRGSLKTPIDARLGGVQFSGPPWFGPLWIFFGFFAKFGFCGPKLL
jgi:hypothetical protein